jgi:SOS response regulatory protein OraA/RecX
VTKQVTDQVTKQVTDQVTKQVTDQVTKQVTRRVTDRVTRQVTASVTEEVTRKHIMNMYRRGYRAEEIADVMQRNVEDVKKIIQQQETVN